jgi:hypothetical protein
MRFLFSLLLLPVLALPAWAGDAPKSDAHGARMTWEHRFEQANLAHDGHLTLEEAKGGYAVVAKHFEDIDADHKGYVTENDIKAWRVMRKAAHRLAKPEEDRLKPSNAMQVRPIDRKPVAASAAWIMPVAPGRP